nr:centrosomal protein of 135 kDa isoform X3 [Osmia lignaria]
MKMSMEEEYNVAARYRTVRKHLDSLGYKQALTVDGLPLIEKLLADLLQTTESLKHFKSIAQENIEAHVELKSIIDPYKCDNVRLVQECNQLHLDLIKEKESHQKQIKDLKKEIYKLEHECNDLQLASSRNLHRIKELEIESSKKSKRILELQGKCLKPTISNVGLASKKRPVFPLRRPVIEGEPLPRTGSKSKNPLPNLSTVEPKVVDLLSMADHKMNCLSHELATKEKEIMRLKKMLDGGRPYTAVLKDCLCKKTDKDNVDVNELKILQQEKLELEQQLKEALNKQHDAMTQALKLADRNEELEKELRDIDHIALAVEADCNSTVKETNKRVSKLQQKLEEVMTQVHVLEGELTVERREVQELKADLEVCRMEKNNIKHTLESTLDEKKQMTDRINELIVIETNLNDEIERLARENEKQRQDIIQLQYSNKLLKDQMNMMEILKDNDIINIKRTREKGKRNDDNNGQNGIEIHETHKEKEIQNENGVWYNNVLRQLNEKETQINNLQQTVEQLGRERDFYRDEYNKIKDYHNKTIDKDHADLWTRIRELKLQLTEKESAVDELQREKKELYREKVNLEMRLKNYKAEHKSSCRPCNVCKRGNSCNCSLSAVKDISKTKSIIERLEHERDVARADVERLIEERDALRERLKMAAEAHTSEQHRLRENLTDVEARLKQIEKERQELLLTQGSRRATIKGLEDQLQDLREELKRTKQELGTQRTQYFQLRALQDQTDQALNDAQNQLTQSESELNKAFDRSRAMERQQLQLESQVKELQQEICNLKTKMTHLDHEKDQLLMVLDEKTERIAALEKEIMLKDQQVMGSEQQIRELQQKNEMTIDQSAEQDRQLRMMQLEVENLQRQLHTASYDRENAIQENQRVQDDLAAVTCEVRNLQRELDASRAECSDLKRQLQTYVGEVRRAEELLNRKENERTEMLNHFRSLSLEATVLENNNHSLESEAAEARGALHSARDRLLDFERQLADKDSLIRGYETQISELTQNVASMETQLRQQGEQRHRTEADLNAVRDLCVKLDQQKDTLMQQMDDKDAIKAQYDMQIAKLKAEQVAIQDQMNRDRVTVERLEMLLEQARQESITAQANNQELQNEMSRLRQKMSELQNKLSSESSKLRQYQTQAAEYCKQISELRRQVTNERFDRARKDEESRRHSEGLPDSLVQTPHPTNQNPNESNDTGFATRRYLQNEEHDGTTDRSGMKMVDDIAVSRFGYLKVESNYRCNNRPKEIQRDVPCINIILRSDCKMHSNQYNYVQKENAQNENKPEPRNNEDLVKTNVQRPTVSGLNSPGTKYNSTYFNTDNHFDVLQTLGMKYNYTAFDIENKLNVSQSVGVQNKAQCNQGTKQLASNSTSKIRYSSPLFSYYPVHSTEISNDSKALDNAAKKRLAFSKNSNVVLNDKIANIVCTNKSYNISKNNYDKYTSLEESTFNKTISRNKKLTKFLHQDDINFCTDTTCTKTNCSASTTKRENKHKSTHTDIKCMHDVTTSTLLKSTENFHYNREREKKCINTIDTALDTVQNMLKGVKKFEDKDIDKQNAENYHYQEVRCKNMGCNYLNAVHDVAVSKYKQNCANLAEIIKPEYVKMLQEIKEQTMALEEQLIIMNKNMKIKKRTIEKLMSAPEYQDTYNTEQQRDIITQNPEKRNICVQEPSESTSYVNCMQYTTLKPEKDNDEQDIKKQDVALKKSKHKREVEQNCKNFTGQQENKDHRKDINNFKRTHNVQIQCIRSFHIIDASSFKSFSTSTSKKVNPANNKNKVYYISRRVQSSLTSKENLRSQRINKTMLDKLIINAVEMNNKGINDEQESLTYEEKAIMMLLLAKSISNKCLKSKHKKSELINFKPKCIIDSCIPCDQRLVKCKLSKRKMQIPVVFKQSKPIKYNDEQNIYSNQNSCECLPLQSENNLVTTVCTQSSNLQITTATSVSCTSFNNRIIVDNVIEERRTRGDACILS